MFTIQYSTYRCTKICSKLDFKSIFYTLPPSPVGGAMDTV